MTHSLCPACRTAVSLDTTLCPRCGLAVRPTCSNCGEALSAGSDACPRCREPIESVPPPPLLVAEPVAAPETEPTAEVATVRTIATTTRAPKRQAAGTQLIVIALIAGLLVAGGLLALELFAPRPEAPVDLVRRSFPSFGFSVSRPANWSESSRRDGVTFGPDHSRGFTVTAVATRVAAARAQVDRERQAPPGNKQPISLDTARVDGRPALLYTLVQDDQYRQIWWVERPGGTFRIEFWAPEYNRRDAGELAEHIVETFAVG